MLFCYNNIVTSVVNFCNYFLPERRINILVEKWTGRLIGKMHNNGVTAADLANELGVTKAYISMILNGARKPTGARERLENAADAIITKRKEKAL
jgi:hypothetical protein